MIPCLFIPKLEVDTTPINGVRARMILRCAVHGDEGILEVHVFGTKPYWFNMNGRHHSHSICEAGLFVGDATGLLDAAAQTMVDIVRITKIWDEPFKARLESAAIGTKKRRVKEFTERVIAAINE